MRVSIKGTNIELTPAIRQYINEQVGELERFTQGIGSPIEARVEVGKPSKHHRKGDVFYAEINLRLPGRVLRAQSTQEDLFFAINVVRDQLQRDIKRYKKKQDAKFRRGARSIKKLVSLSPLARFRRKKGQRERNEEI